ncbi:midasin [Skeletonema marinoi]|uniref:Midasin n=2 Tax=Skeletonema marinoi TaxID=267567 RepID=A0AAD8XZI2_9STRA|nr:midasin [Skeletonema marinoi]
MDCDDATECGSGGANDGVNITIPYLRRLIFYAEALAYGAPKTTLSIDDDDDAPNLDEDGESLVSHLAQILLLAADPLNLISSKTVPSEFFEDGDIGRVVDDEAMQENDDTENEEATDECIPYKFIPLRVKGGRKRDPTRIDALRHLLRALAPIALDVATRACCHVLVSNTESAKKKKSNTADNDDNDDVSGERERLQAFVLMGFWISVAPQLAPIISDLFNEYPNLAASNNVECPLSILPFVQNKMTAGEGISKADDDEEAEAAVVAAEAATELLDAFCSKRNENAFVRKWWNWDTSLFILIHAGSDLDYAKVVKEENNTNNTESTVKDIAYFIGGYSPETNAPHCTHWKEPLFQMRWFASRAVGSLFSLRPLPLSNFLKSVSVYDIDVPFVRHPWSIDEESALWEKNSMLGVGRIVLPNTRKIKLEMKSPDDNVAKYTFPIPSIEDVRDTIQLHPSLVHAGRGALIPRRGSVVSYHHWCQSDDESQERYPIQSVPLFQRILQKIKSNSRNGKVVLIVCIRVLTGSPSANFSCQDDELLELHVDEETDSKTLLGSYVATDIPGEFIWMPGPLTTAARSGRWVLIEDVDSCPEEIQAALLRLLEERVLPLGVGKEERCHPGFRLFGTCLTHINSDGRPTRRLGAGGKRILQPNLWRKVHVNPLPFAELQEVGQQMHPDLPKSVAEAVLNVLRRLDNSGRDDEGDNTNNDQTRNSGHMKEGIFGHGARSASVREYIKLLSRIASALHFEPGSDYVTESQRLDCLAETVDIFAMSCPNIERRRDFISQIAAPIWGLTADAATRYIEGRIPSISAGGHMNRRIEIGRTKFAREEEELRRDKPCARLMESVAVCAAQNEPALLVGETGCGKTTIVQRLANLTGQSLLVQNLSLQTDSTDLLGGYKPLEMRHVARGVYDKFVDLFVSSFSRSQNAQFLRYVLTAFEKGDWKKLAQCFLKAAGMGEKKMNELSKKGKEANNLELWSDFRSTAERFERQRVASESGLAFLFTEGALVDAIRTGKWVLLDEINLASSETLQRLCGLLDDAHGSITLTEKAMNPATDAGKKDLPASIRSRFTEIYVDELYLDKAVSTNGVPLEHSESVMSSVDMYLKCRSLSEQSLVDGGGQRPRYTMRTLCRTLVAARNLVIQQRFAPQRALLEGFELAFEGSLDLPSRAIVQKQFKSMLSKGPEGRNGSNAFVMIKPFWIKSGPADPTDWADPVNSPDGKPKFVLTPSATGNLRRLCQAVASGPWSVLLEGPTSAGKTSLVEYLAARCGHRCVRINNHEHTDIQEYTGSYAADSKGKISFQEGILVQALRKGHWVILDELNLAPSEVLEALNRLLDDNRELYLAEINEVVKPHENFRLFATQNPAGAYGGRKPLSKAFRNRFVEVHMSDIPEDEMIVILERRCDLLRWANRGASSKSELAAEGYMLLAERLRVDEEKEVVRSVIEKEMKVSVELDELYYGKGSEGRRLLSEALGQESSLAASGIDASYFSTAMHNPERASAASRRYGVREDDRGSAAKHYYAKGADIVNCHASTETSDLLGGFRPVRGRQAIATDMVTKTADFLLKWEDPSFDIEEIAPSFMKQQQSTSDTPSDSPNQIIDFFRKLSKSYPCEEEASEGDKKRRKFSGGKLAMNTDWAQLVSDTHREMEIMFQKHSALFEWADGPLVLSMKDGNMILLDEMSLAEDAVLERLNSVLEPSRTLVLAEKGGEGPSCVHETDDTTQIFSSERTFSSTIEKHMLDDNTSVQGITEIRRFMLDYFEWFNVAICDDPASFCNDFKLSLRDVLSWARFIADVHIKDKSVDLFSAFAHGASLMHLDGLGLGTGVSNQDATATKNKAKEFLYSKSLHKDELQGISNSLISTQHTFGVEPFTISTGREEIPQCLGFNLTAPTTGMNLRRVLRGLQISKPILLEGSPGVGKTSLISALAKASGHHLVRINLSEQTDISDLMGSDLPYSSEGLGLLDELNLASQSVLEGLNSCLDHRASVYVPELGLTFDCPPTFRIFGAQNPLAQGGGRKGLPNPDIVENIISFNQGVQSDIDLRLYGQHGSPWEFNLRDIFRWCQLLTSGGNSVTPDFVARYADMLYTQRLRTDSDRTLIENRFRDHFGDTFKSSPNAKLEVTKDSVVIGKTVLQRFTGSSHWSGVPVKESEADLSESLLRPMEAVASCIRMNWACLLIGPPSSGKSALLKNIAGACNVHIETLAMTSSTDVTELIGCFEQTDSLGMAKHVIATIRHIYDGVCVSGSVDGELVQKINHYYWCISREISKLKDKDDKSSMTETKLSYQRLGNCWNILKQSCPLPLIFHRISLTKSQHAANAMERGYWLHLENVNFCPSSVLDRLNPLMEFGGELVMTECGIADEEQNAKPRVIKPHPNFRLFLSMNPNSHGEVSRAMRNRCIEVYVLPSKLGSDHPDTKTVSEVDTIDAFAGIWGMGIRSHAISQFLVQSHVTECQRSCEVQEDPPHINTLKQWGNLSIGLMRRGMSRTSIEVSHNITYENDECSPFHAHGSALMLAAAATGIVSGWNLQANPQISHILRWSRLLRAVQIDMDEDFKSEVFNYFVTLQPAQFRTSGTGKQPGTRLLVEAISRLIEMIPYGDTKVALSVLDGYCTESASHVKCISLLLYSMLPSVASSQMTLNDTMDTFHETRLSDMGRSELKTFNSCQLSRISNLLGEMMTYSKLHQADDVSSTSEMSVIAYRWMKKAFANFQLMHQQAEDTNSEHCRLLKQLLLSIEALDEVIQESTGGSLVSSDILWKRSGHPLLPSKRNEFEDLNTLQAISKSCALTTEDLFGFAKIGSSPTTVQVDLKKLISLNHGSLFAKSVFRRELLGALGLTFWAATDETKDVASKGTAYNALKVLTRSFSKSKDEFVASVHLATIDTSIKTRSTRAFGEIQCAQIGEILCISEEAAIVGTVSQILQKYYDSDHSEVITDLRKLEGKIKSFVNNHLLIRNDQRVIFGRIKLSYGHWRVMVQYFQRPRFNQLSSLSPALWNKDGSDLPRVQESSSLFDAASKNVILSSCAGPSRTELNVQRAALFRLLRLPSQDVGTVFSTVENGEARKAQAKKLINLFAQKLTADSIVQPTEIIRYLALNVLGAFQEEFRVTDIVHLLSNGASELVAIFGKCQTKSFVNTSSSLQCHWKEAGGKGGSAKLVLDDVSSKLSSYSLHFATKQLFTLAEQASKKKAGQQKKIIERPSNSPPFQELFREMHHFCRTVASTNNVLSLADAIENQPNSRSQEINWQYSAAAFSDRLSSVYSMYEDITIPCLSEIRSIQRGLRELALNYDVSSRAGAIVKMQDALLSYPIVNKSFSHHLTNQSYAEVVKELSHRFGIDGCAKQDVGAILRSIELATLMRLQVGSKMNRQNKLHGETLDQVNAMFASLAQSTGIESFTADTADKDAIVDQEEKELREYFPDHGAEFQRIVAKLEHEEDESDEEDDIVKAKETAQLSDLEWMKKSQEEQKFLGSHMFALTLRCSVNRSLWSPLLTNDAIRDFHSDPFPSESVKADAPLRSLLIRVGQLLGAFPGHSVLVAIGQIVEKVRQLDIHTNSLGKVMSGLEVILRKAQDWEQHASQHVQLGKPLKEISSLVATWRKLELQSWSHLLTIRENRRSVRPRRHWARLYALIHGISESEELRASLNEAALKHGHSPSWIWKGYPEISKRLGADGDVKCIEDLAKVLDTFILTSNIAEFRTRLDLIENFANELRNDCEVNGPTRVTLTRLLLSFCNYYSRFEPLISKTITTLREPIEKRLKDEVKLAKWDEQSYYALAESSEKNHRKLMKFLRDYDEALDTSVLSVLEQNFAEGVRSMNQGTAADHEPVTTMPSNVSIFPQLSVGGKIIGDNTLPPTKMLSVSVPTGLSSKTRYTKRMKTVIPKGTSWAYNGAVAASEMSDAIFQRIDSLREPKVTKQVKQRALTDLFKSLKDQGYSSMKWSVPFNLHHTHHMMQLPVPSLCGQSFWDNSVSTSLDKANHTSIDVRLRYHDFQRSMLANMIQSTSTIESILRSYKGVAESLPMGQMNINRNIASFEESLSLLVENLNQLILPMKEASQFVDNDQDRGRLRDAIALITGCVSKLEENYKFCHGQTPITSQRVESISVTMTKTLAEVRMNVQSCIESCGNVIPSSLFVSSVEEVHRCYTLSLCVKENVEESIDATSKSPTVRATTAAISALVQRILISAQSICDVAEGAKDVESNDDDYETTDDSSSLFRSNAKMIEEWSNLRQDRLIDGLESLSESLTHLHNDISSNDYSRSLCTRATVSSFALADNIQEVSKSRLQDALTFYQNHAKFLYILLRVFRNLVAKGFCSDDVSDGGEGDGEGGAGDMKFEDDVEGTGMGEGDGKNDVTDEIENEEQLLGLKGDEDQDASAQQERKELKEDEVDTGMEMENDFDGEKFDLPDQPEDQKEDDNGDDEEEELDREMGDGDDPNEQVVTKRCGTTTKMMNQDQEKFEEDSKMAGEQLEDEMRTKEDENDDEDAKGKDGGEEHKPSQPEVDESKPEDSKDESADKDENPIEDDMVNDDTEDKYEDKHDGVDVRNENEDEEEGDEDLGIDLNDGLNLDDGEDANDDNASEDGDMDDNIDEDADTDDNDGGEDGNTGEIDPEEEDDDEEMREPDNMEPVGQGGAGDEEQQNEPEAPDDEDQTPRSQPPPKSDYDSNEQLHGVAAEDGQDQPEDDDADEGMADENNTGGAEEDDPTGQSSQGDGGNGDDGNWQKGRDEEQDGSTNQSEQHNEVPNPFRSPGDAEKFWHKRLDIIQDDSQREEETDVSEEQANEEENKQKDGQFEYTMEGEQNSGQVLGVAEEEQAMQLNEADDDDVEPQNNQEDQINMDTDAEEKRAQQQNSSRSNRKDNAEPKQSDVKEEKMEDPAEVSEMDTHAEEEEDVEEDESNAVVKTKSASFKTQSTDDASDDDNSVGDEQFIKTSMREASSSHGALGGNKLRGDYRTGKRVNMKRIIGYIASGYRKDKIWLRRTKPAKRDYRVLIAVDDSESMQNGKAGDMALRALATLANGMSQLEIGQLGVASFGEDMKLIHPFNLPFTSESGVNIASNFTFNAKRTRTALCIESSIAALDSAKKNMLMVMIIVEGEAAESKKKNESILNMKEVSFVNGKPKIKHFIEDYPFPFYLVVEDLAALPEILGDALRQWFEMLAQIQNAV